jgi:hypothetical protein
MCQSFKYQNEFNRHNLNYKAVDVVEIYNFGVEFTSIRVYMKTLWVLENILTRDKKIP